MFDFIPFLEGEGGGITFGGIIQVAVATSVSQLVVNNNQRSSEHEQKYT